MLNLSTGLGLSKPRLNGAAAPAPAYQQALKFNDARNSQYLAALAF